MSVRTFDPNNINELREVQLSSLTSLTQVFNKLMFFSNKTTQEIFDISENMNLMYRGKPVKNSIPRIRTHLIGMQNQGTNVIINDKLIIGSIPVLKKSVKQEPICSSLHSLLA